MRLIACSLLAGSLLLTAGGVAAQDFPNRVVRVIVGDTPGAASDTAIRLLSQKLSDIWKQQVVVENRPGANWIIAAEVAAKAKPDGYTFLAAIPSLLTMNQVVYKSLPYDTLRDFAGVTQIATNHFAVIVNPSLPARTVADLVKLAKARPGEMLYGSPGVGNQQHLAVEIFARATDIKIVHVPHRGTAPAVLSLISGQVAMAIPAALVVAPHVASGKLRMLATLGPKRVNAFPDVPTLVESGYPDVLVTGWTGLVAPRGTPQDILDKVARDVARVLTADDVRSVLATPGSDLTSSSPREFDAFIRSEMDKWAKVIRAVGLENTQ